MNLMSSAVLTARLDGVVSLFEGILVAGAEVELSENVTRDFVGVDFSALVRGILEIKFIELFFD